MIISWPSQGQDQKVEVERFISVADMPDKSNNLLKAFRDQWQNLKYIKETGGGTTSYESKFLWQGKYLSVEFYESGDLMDIEQLVPFRKIDEDIRNKLDAYFSENYIRHRIRRTQIQFSAEDSGESDSEVIEEFKENDWDDLTIRYEIVAEIENRTLLGPYEFLFDQSGKLIDKQKIDRRSTDNILY
ncbi:MAG: hypothetical protein ACNS62_08910 [Candidatus Cyclobacteriaceae bacterium M3_2C_046]